MNNIRWCKWRNVLMINEEKNWLWAGWVASYLQRSLSAQVNGGPDATSDRWKQPFSAVRASGGCPGNDRCSGAVTIILLENETISLILHVYRVFCLVTNGDILLIYIVCKLYVSPWQASITSRPGPNSPSHRENVPSAKLPQMRMSSWGSVPNFSLTPNLAGLPPAGLLSVPSAHCSRQALMAPLINCN